MPRPRSTRRRSRWPALGRAFAANLSSWRVRAGAAGCVAILAGLLAWRFDDRLSLTLHDTAVASIDLLPAKEVPAPANAPEMSVLPPPLVASAPEIPPPLVVAAAPPPHVMDAAPPVEVASADAPLPVVQPRVLARARSAAAMPEGAASAMSSAPALASARAEPTVRAEAAARGKSVVVAEAEAEAPTSRR